MGITLFTGIVICKMLSMSPHKNLMPLQCLTPSRLLHSILSWTPYRRYSANIFEGYKFRGFRCFPAKHENYFHKNKQMPIVMWLNYYACKVAIHKIYFSQNRNFNKTTKFIAHEIICTVQ